MNVTGVDFIALPTGDGNVLMVHKRYAPPA